MTPMIAGAESAYCFPIKMVTNDNVITLADYKLAYDATTNPQGIRSVDDYQIWFEPLGALLYLKVTGSAIVKSSTAFTLVADSSLNNVYVNVWIIPRKGITRTIL